MTPEPEFSYVSFETNIAKASYTDLIQRVIELFLPGKFILTIFAHKVSLIFLSSKFREKRGRRVKCLDAVDLRVAMANGQFHLSFCPLFCRIHALQSAIASC